MSFVRLLAADVNAHEPAKPHGLFSKPDKLMETAGIQFAEDQFVRGGVLALPS
jgi:hypothetical protein